MFLCISANPAIDNRVRVSELRIGKVNRTSEVTRAAGGKTAHVAMILHALGGDPLWIGFTGGATGEELVQGLQKIGMRVQPIQTSSSCRTNLEIIDDHEAVTEILEPGGAITGKEAKSFLDACEEYFVRNKSNAYVIISGSLPPGASQGIYAELIRMARSHECHVYLDSSGEPLRLGIQQKPDFVKPNREEVEFLTGQNVGSPEEARDALTKILGMGARSAAISLGSAGLVWSPGEGQGVYAAYPPEVRVRSTVGCGDATVAAFAWAAANKFAPEDTLRLAAACGAANCEANLPCQISISRARELERSARIEKLA